MNQIPFQGDKTEQKTALRFIFYFLKIVSKEKETLEKYIDKITFILVDGLVQNSQYKLKPKFLGQLIPEIKM